MITQECKLLTIPLSGLTLLEASAGTGKTYAIASLYVRFVLELGRLPEQILVTTYTEAATAELKGRIRERLAAAAAFSWASRSTRRFMICGLGQDSQPGERVRALPHPAAGALDHQAAVARRHQVVGKFVPDAMVAEISVHQQHGRTVFWAVQARCRCTGPRLAPKKQS